MAKVAEILAVGECMAVVATGIVVSISEEPEEMTEDAPEGDRSPFGPSMASKPTKFVSLPELLKVAKATGNKKVSGSLVIVIDKSLVRV